MRQFFGLEKGIDVYAENGGAVLARILTDTAAPDGLGDQSSAPIGSLYIRSGTGQMYQKIANAGNSSDWQQFGNITIDQLSWRNETVRAATNDTVSAGVVDPTAWSDNESLDGNDFTVGQYLIGDLNGVPALFEVTVVTSATSITVVAASQAIASNDTFVVQAYLPDSPAAQEQEAIVHIPVAGSPGVKIADVNWNIADGINLTAGYAAANGSISNADTVNSAIQKLDGNQQDIQTASGISQGSVDYGTFTGDIIPDNSTNKAALQALETELVDTRDNVDDLITLSGVAENSVDLGAFSAPGSFLLTATETIKSALQKLADYFFGLRVIQTVGVTTITAVDSVAHATYRKVSWHVEVFVTATPANRESFIVDAITDGTNVDDTKYAKLKIGANIAGLASSVAINGANLELRIVSTPSVTVNVRRITVV